ncbi:MAG: alpha/beta hydrolase [Rhodocyclaceae bacterium]|nr:alpha/beta hydrolase [Rhodocyclaceae bacterium]
MISARVDSWLAALSSDGAGRGEAWIKCTQLATPVGSVRVFDSAPGRDNLPVVVFVPDGPNVIEHHAELFKLLTPHLRVVCFDMPGFGFSAPQADYTHALDQGAAAVLGVLDQLEIARAVLAFSCANGFYALHAAKLAPQRIIGLVLSQTPSLSLMGAWTHRAVPWPIRTPVFGQVVGWLTRKKTADIWYQIALPLNADKTPYQSIAKTALDAGGCFCLAGVVQGLSRANLEDVAGVTVPCTMVWGSLDHSHKYTEPSSLLRDVPHAEIVTFSDAGHFPELEQAKRYAALLIERAARNFTASSTSLRH